MDGWQMHEDAATEHVQLINFLSKPTIILNLNLELKTTLLIM